MQTIRNTSVVKFSSKSESRPSQDNPGPRLVPKSQEEGRGERILVVDDQQDWLWIAREVLLAGGYQVEVCEYSPDALLLLETQPEQIDLVITDLNMPCLDGVELAARLREINAALPIVLTSAATVELTPVKLQCLGFRGFLTKPWERELLFSTIRQALASARLNKSGS